MINITLIPSIKEHYKDQFEICIDLRLITFIKKTFSKNAKIFFSIKKKIDLVILSGGNDLPYIKKSKKNIIRDKLNHDALNYAKKNNIPIVGYCAGAQYLASKYRSKISYTKHHVGYHKLFNQEKNIFNKINFPKITNSYHNYKIQKLGKDLEAISIAPDNSIEFFMHKKKRIYGIMWHPEREKKIREFDIKLLKKISCI
tara:strand:+ start:489 stop:1088 length:600 start_codon:yes stop_codon:yes gene_type:complete